MKVLPNPMTVGDYLESVKSGSIRVNRSYQRGGGIWSPRAKSSLVETIILGHPMPALFLHQMYDRDTRKPYRDLVDGQQRTNAIEMFYGEQLTLSPALPTFRLRRAKLKTLDEDDYRQFISYSLPIFLFTDASEADVRESFRRINSHTSVLNAEERRHSRYQGAMKWFILSLTQDVQGFLASWQVFPPVKLIRMQDAKLVSEVVLTMKSGIDTVKSRHLDALYSDYDDDSLFNDQDSVREAVVSAFREIQSWDFVPNTPLIKTYHLGVLVVAVIHASQGLPALAPLIEGKTGLRSGAEIRTSLSELVAALESSDSDADEDTVQDDPVPDRADEAAGDQDESDEDDETASRYEAIDPRVAKYREFIVASASKTNTAGSRRTRFLTFMRAISRAK